MHRRRLSQAPSAAAAAAGDLGGVWSHPQADTGSGEIKLTRPSAFLPCDTLRQKGSGGHYQRKTHAPHIMREEEGFKTQLTSNIKLKSTRTVPEHMDVKLFFLFVRIMITMYSCSIHSFTLYSFYENAGMLVGLYILSSFVIALLSQ